MENRISEARRSYSKEHGKFTQADAAAYFGVSVGTYAHWEQGAGKLNGEILKRIAVKYECSVDYLLCVDSPPKDKAASQSRNGGLKERPLWQGSSLSLATIQPEKSFLSKQLKKCRKGRGISVRAVSEAIGKGEKAIYAWENDDSVPGADTLLALCRFYKVDISYFFPPDVAFLTLGEEERDLLRIYRSASQARKDVLMVMARGVERECGAAL